MLLTCPKPNLPEAVADAFAPCEDLRTSQSLGWNSGWGLGAKLDEESNRASTKLPTRVFLNLDWGLILLRKLVYKLRIHFLNKLSLVTTEGCVILRNVKSQRDRRTGGMPPQLRATSLGMWWHGTKLKMKLNCLIFFLEKWNDSGKPCCQIVQSYMYASRRWFINDLVNPIENKINPITRQNYKGIVP